MTLTVGSLFTGIGGIDLGLERAGMVVRWQAETDPFAAAVLSSRWPDVPNLGDVSLVDWTAVEPVDILCGGYPCQPFSLAGGRRGIEDPRHVWPNFAHAVRDVGPRYVLLENVPGHLSLGFGRVLGDLAALGYDAEWTCLSAAAVGAPHLRVRLFVVAYPCRDPLRDQPAGFARRLGAALTGDDGDDRVVADADVTGLPDRGGPPAPGGRAIAAGDDPWRVEPDVGRVADGVPSRVDRLRCLGNAVVPQVAELVGRAVLAGEEE